MHSPQRGRGAVRCRVIRIGEDWLTPLVRRADRPAWREQVDPASESRHEDRCWLRQSHDDGMRRSRLAASRSRIALATSRPVRRHVMSRMTTSKEAFRYFENALSVAYQSDESLRLAASWR